MFERSHVNVKFEPHSTPKSSTLYILRLFYLRDKNLRYSEVIPNQNAPNNVRCLMTFIERLFWPLGRTLEVFVQRFNKK